MTTMERNAMIKADPGHEFCKIQNWYPALANNTLLCSFVKLRDEEKTALKAGDSENPAGREVIKRMYEPMKTFRGNSFVSVDMAAPTDTERFEGKRGAVYSAKSAWKYLCESKKIQASANAGDVDHIVIRPFRSMNQTREFRLFIHGRELKAMSQYWLIRHFRRLEGMKQKYWDLAARFVESIAWVLPVDNIVMDIYITSANEIIIIDFNPWGTPTNPLLFGKWDIDWSATPGIKLMPPPLRINGDINVSF